MKYIQEYYSDIGVPKVYQANAEGLLRLACIAERDATQILSGLPISKEEALHDDTLCLDVYFAEELATIASLRFQVCLCVEKGCDAGCPSCVDAFERMLQAETELEILSK